MNQHGRKISEVSEAREAFQSRAMFQDRLVEKWNARPEGHKLDRLYTVSKTKARITAHMLENEARHLKWLKESGTQISSAFATTPENVLRIVRIGVANSNRPDIFTEWPLTSTNDALYYVDKVFGTSSAGATAGNRIYEGGAETANYASSYEISNAAQSANGILTTFTQTLSPAPLKKYSVVVMSAGKAVGNDDGNNSLSGTGIVSGTVDYTTGAVSVVLSAAPLTGEVVSFLFSWDSEDSSLYNTIRDVKLAVVKKVFRLLQLPVSYSYSKMSELVFGTTGLGDFEEQVVRAVGDAHAMRKDYTAFQIAKRYALGNTVATFDADFAAAGEDNDFNHAQRILTTINNVSASIYDSIKRGEVNKIVGSAIAVNYLKKHKLWKADSSQPRVGGSYLAGKLDNIDVYVTPGDASTAASSATSGELICVYKNPQEEGEPAIAFGVLTELAAALDYPNLYRQGVLATVEGNIVTQSQYLRLIKITNIV